MMIIPTKRRKELLKMFEEEVAPWCYFDEKASEIKLKEDALKEKFYLYKNR